MPIKVSHFRFICGGGVAIESADGMDQVTIVETKRPRGRVSLLRQAAKKLRALADQAEAAARMPERGRRS